VKGNKAVAAKAAAEKDLAEIDTQIASAVEPLPPDEAAVRVEGEEDHREHLLLIVVASGFALFLLTLLLTRERYAPAANAGYGDFDDLQRRVPQPPTPPQPQGPNAPRRKRLTTPATRPRAAYPRSASVASVVSVASAGT